jgi:RNase H-like domain found in reverse transcriptase
VKRDTPFVWAVDCTTAILWLSPLPQPSDNLEVDVFGFATGGILTQRDEQDKPRPIAYISQTLNDAERNYSIHDHEHLVVMRGLCAQIIWLSCSPFACHCQIAGVVASVSKSNYFSRTVGSRAVFRRSLDDRPSRIAAT